MFACRKLSLLQWPSSPNLKHCTQIHAQMIVTGMAFHLPSISNLLQALTDPIYGNITYAVSVFSHISKPSAFLYNTVIRGCLKKYLPRESVLYYIRMRREGVKPDIFTFQFLFQACSLGSLIRCGQVLHSNFIKLLSESDAYIESTLIHMYSEFSLLDDSRRVFDQMVVKNVFHWTTMIGGYVKNGWMEEARNLFDVMPERNTVSWTSMIMGYSRTGQDKEAIGLFHRMVMSGVKPDQVTLLTVLSAYAQLGDLKSGKSVHQIGIKEGGFVSKQFTASLIDMYSKCGNLDYARRVFNYSGRKNLSASNAIINGYCKSGQLITARFLFDQMEEKDHFAFSSMISGYVQNGRFKKALTMFKELKIEGLKPDDFIMVSLLMACANLGALDYGKILHANILIDSIKLDAFLGTALIDMYAKCGRIDQGLVVFDRMERKDVSTWTAMISGFALNGKGKLALAHFFLMKEVGFLPNGITFIGVLNACSHSGLVDEGRQCFHDMVCSYNIQPQVEHYGCMVDLLGRSGCLEEAYKLVQTMPMKPNDVIWGSLLSSCRVYNHLSLAEKAARNLLDLDPHNETIYVLLYNVYASLKRWEDAAKVREEMGIMGIKKKTGCSSIMVNGRVHEFIAGDSSHPQFMEIQQIITEISKRLKSKGYIPNMSQIMLDLDE